MTELQSVEYVSERILMIRGHRVMLDSDLATHYSVTTSRLNQQVKRNPSRFPSDFMFRLTAAEVAELNLLQVVMGAPGHRDPRLRPHAFTEHGCLMLSNVLRSPRAVEISVLIVRAFVTLRAAVLANHDLAQRLGALQQELRRRLGRQSEKLATHEKAILKLLKDIRRLTRFPENTPRGICFTAKID